LGKEYRYEASHAVFSNLLSLHPSSVQIFTSAYVPPLMSETKFQTHKTTGKLMSMHFFSGLRLGPIGTVATTDLLYHPQMIDEGDCGAIGGNEIGKGNQSTWRKSVPVPLCPLQIPHDQAWATTVGSQ
jgi:hypothetical protein